MYRVKTDRISAGMHPSERLATIKTIDGQEQVIVDERSIDENGTICVGFPVGQRDDAWLVELPRETMRGAWRIYVTADQLVRDSPSVIMLPGMLPEAAPAHA